jgi:hypothetical protein
VPVIEGSQSRWRANPVPAAQAAPASYGPFTSAGVPGSGYLNGVAEKGALVVNTATGIWYANTGTLAATAWTVVGAQV